MIVAPLIFFGIGFIGFGFYYRLQSDIINQFIAEYVLQSSYYELSDAIWGWLPWIFIIMGVFFLISAGMAYRSEQGATHYE